MATRRIVRAALATAAAGWLAACGEQAPPASGRAMDAPAPAAGATTARDNELPRIDRVSLDPDSPVPGATLQARVAAVDPDGDPVHLQYVWSVDGRRIAGAQDGSLVVPPLPKGAVLEVAVTAGDGRGQSAPAIARGRVGNRAPAVTGVRLEPAEGARVGEQIVAIVDTEDADGDAVELRYRWRVNEVVRGEADVAERFDTTGLRRGDRVSVRVSASDGEDESEPFTSPSLAIGNGAPEITSLPPAGMGEDGVYRYAVEARDPDGDRSLRFALAAGPEGARVDPLLGEITWTPTLGQAGTHPIEVVVSDGHGGESRQRFEVTVREVVERIGAAQPPAAAPAP